MNNKGFMMAEVIVVASIVLLAFSFFYINYNSLISLYNDRVNYYDVSTLYELANYRNTTLSYNMDESDFTTGYKQLLKEDNKIDTKRNVYYNQRIYILSYNRIMSLVNGVSLNKTFDDFLIYINSHVDFKYNNFVLVMEKCKSDNTNCKYAYLETAVK